MSMVEWKPYSGNNRPPRSGLYLTAYGGDKATEFFPEVSEYFRTGDVITFLESEAFRTADTPEKRLLEMIFGCNEVIADADGFYDYDDEGAFEVIPAYWAELPSPPEGMCWPE